MSESDQHGSHDGNDRRRDGGRDERGFSRDRRDDGARDGQRRDGGYRGGRQDGPGRGRDDARGGYRGGGERTDRGSDRDRGRRESGFGDRRDERRRDDRSGGDRDGGNRSQGGGYRGRDDRGAGYQGRNDRGGYQDRRDDRGNSERRFDRGSEGGERGGGYRGDRDNRSGGFGGGDRTTDRGAGSGGFDRRGAGRSGDRRGGYERRDDRGGRSENRGVDRSDRREGGFSGGNRQDDRSGNRGFNWDRRDGRRDGGFGSGDSRGGYERRDDRGGRREGGFSGGNRRDDRAGRSENRGFGGDRRDDRREGGFRGGSPSGGARSEDRRGGYDRREDRRGAGFGRDDRGGAGRSDDRRGGYERRDDRPGRREGGFSGGNRRDDRGPRTGDRSYGRDDRRGGDRVRDDRRGGARGGDGGRFEREDRRRSHDDGQPRFVAPDIDADVTGREIDRVTRHELDALEPGNAERVSKHLVMAARYVDDDPEFALEHANAAVRKAGRIGVVRETAGIAAYAAGDYALSLKELRTHRRISGSQEHLPMMVDCQRALGRADKALEEATSGAADSLDAEAKAELAMVVSGIHADAGDHAAALAALEIPQLDKNRGFSYSPKLFRAYAEALRAVGRDQESMSWERQALVAEAALGVGQFSEPEIVDLGDDLDEDEAERTVREAQKRHSVGGLEDSTEGGHSDEGFERGDRSAREDRAGHGESGSQGHDVAARHRAEGPVSEAAAAEDGLDVGPVSNDLTSTDPDSTDSERHREDAGSEHTAASSLQGGAGASSIDGPGDDEPSDDEREPGFAGHDGFERGESGEEGDDEDLAGEFGEVPADGAYGYASESRAGADELDRDAVDGDALGGRDAVDAAHRENLDG